MLQKQIIQELRDIVGGKHIITDGDELALYGGDATPKRQTPGVVVSASSAEEVAEVLRLANRCMVPVVPRGSGTSLSGGSTPVPDCILLLTERMDQIVEIDSANMTATVQPGVILSRFRNEVESYGLFYPPDPSSMEAATIGGTIGEGAGGPRGVKYGTTKDYVIGLQVVLPTGEIIHTGGKAVKSVSGYDLTHLFVGSEGTLGVVTEATVRLRPLPEEVRTCLAVFASVEDAARAVSEIIAHHLIPAALELLDEVCIKYTEAYRPAGLPLGAGAVLLIDVDGSESDTERDLNRVSEVVEACGAQQVLVANTRRQREALWEARRSSFNAMSLARPNTIVEDATVPRPRLLDMIKAVRRLAAKHNLQVGIAAHAGDGNLHPRILCDITQEDEMHRVESFIEDLFRETLSLGGTLTGEHGIGTLKAPFLAWQFGEAGVAAMKSIKSALDPNNLLNPGKIFPASNGKFTIL